MADSGSSLTPEKRLLQLIENGGEAGKGGAASASGTQQAKPGPGRFSFASGGGPSAGLNALPEKMRLLFADFNSRFNLKTINKIAQVTLVLLTLLTIANAVYEMKVLGRDPLGRLDVPEHKVAKIDTDEKGFDAAALDTPSARNAFLPFAKREQVQAAAVTNSSAGRLNDMVKNLKLTGISFNPDDPKVAYCMIEDLQKSITSFLHEGDQVAGMKVSKIHEESVELEYENEKIEIH